MDELAHERQPVVTCQEVEQLASRLESVTASKLSEFGARQRAAVYFDKVGGVNLLGPDGLHGLGYAIGLELGLVVGAQVGAEADGLAGYPAATCADGMDFGAGNNQGYEGGRES